MWCFGPADACTSKSVRSPVIADMERCWMAVSKRPRCPTVRAVTMLVEIQVCFARETVLTATIPGAK
jgi:hypothetical protein